MEKFSLPPSFKLSSARVPAPFSNAASILLLVSFVFLSGCAIAEKRANRIDEARAVRDLGEAYLLQGSHARALKEFLHAETLNSKDPYLQNDLGLVYLSLEKAKMAVPHFKKAIALRDDYTPAQNNLATAYIMMEDWNSAIAVLKPLTEELLYATPHYALSNLGWVYFNLKDYNTALSYYLRALRHDPRHIHSLRGRTMTLMAIGNNTDALSSVEKLLEVSPRDGRAWILKGEILEKLNRREDAKKAYAQAQVVGKNTDIEEKAAQALQWLP